MKERAMRASDEFLLQGWYGAMFRGKQSYRWSENWHHDHGEFCGATFVASADASPPGTLSEGYARTAHNHFPDDDDWVCADCFARFQETAGWTVIE